MTPGDNCVGKFSEKVSGHAEYGVCSTRGSEIFYVERERQ